MGAALNIAQAADAYVLADRGSWIAFRNKAALAIAVEGDNKLFNNMASSWSIPRAIRM